jgi:RHS repeat-associated protein
METFLHDPASSIIEYVTQTNDGDVAAISVFTRPSQRVKAEYGKGGRLLKKREWSFEYDRRGRRIAKVRTLGAITERTEYDWDGRDKLRKVTKPDGTQLAYTYDAFGRRVSKTRSGGPLAEKRVEFTWDGEVLAFELDTETGPRAFVHAPGGFEPILQQQGGETYLCVNDHLGMPKELIDGAGRVAWAAAHGAYGAVIASEGDDRAVESPFRLLGQVNDSDADLAWTRFRCFDSDTGTWISTDPLELDGGLNLYGLDGSPSAVVDPLGLSTSGGAVHCYQGVRDASEHLKAQGVPRRVRKQVLESFDRRTISVESAGANQYGLRYYDGTNAQAKGRYLFETFPAGRQGLALPPEWNQMTNITQYQVRPSATIIKGAAGPQGPNYPGGQTQLFVPNLSDLI